MRRCTLHGRKNILKRLLIQVGAFNISLVLRTMLGAGTPRELTNRAASLVLRLIACLIHLHLYLPESAAKSITRAVHVPLDRICSITLPCQPVGKWSVAPQTVRSKTDKRLKIQRKVAFWLSFRDTTR